MSSRDDFYDGMRDAVRELYARRPIQVIQSCNGDRVDEDSVKILNISEDFQGRDNLTFQCPDCGKEHTSLRLG